ncbi:Fic/DOC family protein [Companilactobacillus hulinensis]|uniref:Fic/DOC family protein n=1 Tax=Companilactobacillus hulinensis TaxID=2486007 RepID=UPI000F78A45A|nr:Fic family protein [Companilactobacillus hulinensis]
MNWIEETLQSNGTLKNKLGIKNSKRLMQAENEIVQIKYLSIDKFSAKNIDNLRQTNYYLFSDLYDWAGKFRDGNFHKDKTEFFPRNRFNLAIMDLNNQIEHINEMSYKSDFALATDLGQLLLDLNQFHPFREGNGRTQRIFIKLLARQKGKNLLIDKDSAMYTEYMKASINDDKQLMTRIIYNSISTQKRL